MSSVFSSFYVPRGDVLNDSFNPQTGTYTAFNGATFNITDGNMAIAGGNGQLTKLVQIEDIVWNANDWTYSVVYSATNTNNGQYGVVLGTGTINPYGSANLHCGAAYFHANNKTKLYMLYNGAQIVLGSEVTVLVSDVIKIDLILKNGVATGKIWVNGVLKNTISYTYTYAVSASSKPNMSKFQIVCPNSTNNISNVTVSTGYSKFCDVLFIGDSISAGSTAGSNTGTFTELYRTAASKVVSVWAGSGDTTTVTINSINIALIQSMKPKKVHILLGTNDIGHSIPTSTITTNLNTIITACQSVGAKVYIGTIMPVNGRDNSGVNNYILGLSDHVIIPYHTIMDDPGNPGYMNPAWCDDLIHPNAAGHVVVKNNLITYGL